MSQKWTYHPPSALIVRDADTGHSMSILISEIPQELHPPVWFHHGQAFWRNNGYVTKRLVRAYLEKQPLKEKELRRLGSYILAYTQHIAMVGWVINPSSKAREHYLADMRPLIVKLKQIRERSPFMHEYVNEMIKECLKKAVDPL